MVNAVAQVQETLAGLPRAAREAADLGARRESAVESAHEFFGVEAEGVGDDEEMRLRRAVQIERGLPRDTLGVDRRKRLRLDVNGIEPDIGQPGGRDRHRGGFLDFPTRTDDAARAATEQQRLAPFGAHPRLQGRLLGRKDAGGKRENDVGTPRAELRGDLPDRFADGVAGLCGGRDGGSPQHARNVRACPHGRKAGRARGRQGLEESRAGL